MIWKLTYSYLKAKIIRKSRIRDMCPGSNISILLSFIYIVSLVTTVRVIRSYVREIKSYTDKKSYYIYTIKRYREKVSCDFFSALSIYSSQVSVIVHVWSRRNWVIPLAWTLLKTREHLENTRRQDGIFVFLKSVYEISLYDWQAL